MRSWKGDFPGLDFPATAGSDRPGAALIFITAGSSVSGTVFGHESVCQIPSSQEFVLDSLTQKIAVSKISVNPKSAIIPISSSGCCGISGSYFDHCVIGPNPEWSFFENQPPWGDMDVDRPLRQCGPCKLFDAEFEQGQRGAPFIFDAKKKAAVCLDGSPIRIDDDSLSRNLTVLHDVEAQDEGHGGLNGNHYICLAQSSTSSDSSYEPKPDSREAENSSKGSNPQSEEGGRVIKRSLPKGFELIAFVMIESTAGIQFKAPVIRNLKRNDAGSWTLGRRLIVSTWIAPMLSRWRAA
jgi:hypothetical protein